ncbi:MAG: GDP-mannose 4,6-dehydratase, partial [archaeon]
MKVLLTGSAGFIGFHTAQALIARGDSVIGIDCLNEYYDINLKLARNKILSKSKNYSFYKVNIADKEALFEVIKKEKPDKVINLAAQAGVRYSLTNPEVYEESNLKGFLNILEGCRQFKIITLIYASSSSVYGANTKLPFSEEDRVDTPISLYAATKKSNEEMAFVYHHLFGINVTGLRFFTVYGPYGRPDMALFIFMKSILEGKPISVFNNGNMKRDFTYVLDIVEGIVASLDKGYSCEVFNLARGESQSLLDFIKAIETNVGFEAKKEFLPLQQGDVPVTSADISKAKKMLGYNPKVSINEGVKNF